MSFKSYTEGSLLTFQSALFLAPSIAAVVVLATLYAVRSDLNPNPSIPSYVPEKSAAGNYKKRWMSDSVNLLQEVYRKVRDDDCVLIFLSVD